jgi:hypothetical protein
MRRSVITLNQVNVEGIFRTPIRKTRKFVPVFFVSYNKIISWDKPKGVFMRSKMYEKRLLSLARRRNIKPNIKIILTDEQGRTLYDEDYPEKLFKALQKGDTISDFCKSERIPRKKFYQWLKRYPEFKEAFDKGREAGKEIWRLRCLIPVINPETGNL